MKQLKYITFFIASLLFASAFYSCDKECDCEQNSNAPVIYRVFLEDANSKVPDREVVFARLSQTIRLEGENFVGLTNVLVNGYSCYFNPAFITNTSMVFQINKNVPTYNASDDVRNTIRLEKGDKFVVYNFEIRAAAPSITRISHTMPKVGEWITVEGDGLIEITKIVFPGDIEIATDIISDEKGEFFKVKMPEGVSEDGGSIYVESVNGGAYSPAYFNCKNGMILDFDGKGVHAAWTSNAVEDGDLLSAVIGEGHVSQGKYCPMMPARLAPVKAGVPRAIEVWTSGNEDWRTQFVATNLIPANAPLEEVAFQFDIYVPEDWNNTGFIGVNIANNFSAGNQWTGEFYNYIPWLEGSTKKAFKTSGWETVTVPLNTFYKFSKEKHTFNDVLTFREETSYKNIGLFFHNNDFNLKNITGKDADEGVEFPSSETSIKVYVDNFRLVSLATPEYSDYPDSK